MSYSSVYTRVPLTIIRSIKGPIVACLTFSNIRITTSPPRCNIPKIGGFSFARVPRPRSPFRRRLRGDGLFFDRLGMALMSCHHIDFVALVLPLQHDRSAAVDDPLSELLDHGPGIILVDVEFLGDLQSREVQAHEIEAGDPGPQGQVMAGEDGVGQVVKSLAAGPTLIALAKRLSVVPAVL